MNQCMFCDRKLKSIKQLENHETKCELYSQFIQKENDGTLKCTKCFRNFDSQRDIFIHMKLKHFLGIVVKNGRKYVRCRQEPFDEKTKHKKLCSKFNDFVVKINGKWSCKLCDKKSDTQDGIFKHCILKHEQDHRLSHHSVSLSEVMEVKEKSKMSLVEAFDLLEAQSRTSCPQPGPSTSERSAARLQNKSSAQARPGPSRPSKRSLEEMEYDLSDSDSDEIEIQGRTKVSLFQALDYIGDSQLVVSEPSKEPSKTPGRSSYSPSSKSSLTMVFQKSPSGDFEVSSSSQIKRSKMHRRRNIQVPDSTQKDVYDFTDEDSTQASPYQSYVRSQGSPEQRNPDQTPPIQGTSGHVSSVQMSPVEMSPVEMSPVRESIAPKTQETHISRPQISSTERSTLVPESPDYGSSYSYQGSPCVQDKTQQPSSTQIILQPSQDSDSDSDIEIIEDIETKEEPLEPYSPPNLVISDVQGSVQEDIFQHSTEDFETQNQGFTGALTKLYVCDFCDTKFSGENFAIEHLKKFHKIPKNYKDCISIKNLKLG